MSGSILVSPSYISNNMAIIDRHHFFGFLLIDLYEITYEKLTAGVLADAVHPNKYGHQIMGEALTAWLEENIETVLK